MGQRVNPKRIALNYVQSIWIGLRNFIQGRQTARVLFNGEHFACAFREQPPRQTTRPGADLKDITLAQIPCLAGNFRGKIQIQQKVFVPEIFAHLVRGVLSRHATGEVDQLWSCGAHPCGHAQCFDQAGRIGDVFACNVKGGSVIWRGSDET